MRIFLIQAMNPILAAIDSAALALLTIAETTTGERSRRATTAALVFRAVERRLLSGSGCGFLAARAEAELDRLPRGTERSALRSLLRDAGEAGHGALVACLVDYACALEITKRLPEAEAALGLALSLAPEDAEVALHAGRIARKLGKHEEALAWYVRARKLDARGGLVARLAAIGEAVVSGDPEQELSRAIRAAVVAGDVEAAAVGLEERARVRRAAGRQRQAARDLCVAAWRFTDATDRARVAHELADLVIAKGDALAGREALLLAITFGSAAQRDHARGRLHTLAHGLGDEVGTRRWRSAQRPPLVSLLPAQHQRAEISAAPMLTRWREALEAADAVSG